MRVVSLVPSLTEAVALTAPDRLVGATDYCTHPAELDVPRVGGSKYPSVERILALRPDLVLAVDEENRLSDVDALRAAGIRVWVGFPRSVDTALAALRDMFAVLELEPPPWLAAAEAAWSTPFHGYRRRAVIPVWRRPWVVLGSETFAGDVLDRLGIINLYAGSPQRYPRPARSDILAREPELVVLPDEPYAFTADDGPEAFPGIRCALVSGRHLMWYGPSLVDAPAVLSAALC